MMIDLKDIYRYAKFIYECKRCGQQYPIWMVSDKDWKKGVKAMGFGPAKHICKRCFEEFNNSPKYLTLDEYLRDQEQISRRMAELIPNPNNLWEISPEGLARKRETVAAVWDLPSSYTDEEWEEITGTKLGIGRSGPYRKGKQ